MARAASRKMSRFPRLGPNQPHSWVIRSLRRAATKVVVFQWPCGTLATSRSPRGSARADFFEADVVPIEEPPHHTGADHDTVLPQLAADFLQRQIRLRSNQSQQQLLVRIHRRSFAPYRLGRHRPGPPPQRNPPDRGARADLKDGSRFSARGPRLNRTNHPLTQVLGIGPRHRSSPESFDPARLAYPSEFENPFLSDTDSNRWDCALANRLPRTVAD